MVSWASPTLGTKPTEFWTMRDRIFDHLLDSMLSYKRINFDLITGRPNIWLGHNNLKHNRKTNSNTRNKFDQIFRALYLLNVYALYLVKVKRNSKQYQRRETTNKSKPKKHRYISDNFSFISCVQINKIVLKVRWDVKKRNDIKRWVFAKLMFCSWNMHSFYGLVILLPFYLERCYTYRTQSSSRIFLSF